MQIQCMKLMIVHQIAIRIRKILELPDNAVCYIDDTSIPHSWYTIEDYGNKLYIKHKNCSIVGEGVAIPTSDAFMVSTIPVGNYTGPSLASAIQAVIHAKWVSFSVVYNPGRGSRTFSAGYIFKLLSDEMGIISQSVGWVFYDINNNPVNLEVGNLKSMNDVKK